MWRYVVIVGLIAGCESEGPIEAVGINELVARAEAGATDEAGEVEDWIELHNVTDEDYALAGWSLGRGDDTQWAFPTMRCSGGRFLMVCVMVNPRMGRSTPTSRSMSQATR